MLQCIEILVISMKTLAVTGITEVIRNKLDEIKSVSVFALHP